MDEPQPTTQRWWLRRLVNRLEVDQAVFYALIARGWQFVAGPVSMVLIATFFTAELQGYFYTFAGLLALQVFVELGLHAAIVNIASHEWAGLRLDMSGNLVGDPASLQRLVSLGRQVAIWYGVISVLFLIGVGICGTWFFRQGDLPAAQWLPQWWILVVLSAAGLWTMPFVSLLEGCHQVATVNRLRAVQAVAGNAAVWTCIVLGYGLWAAVAATAVRLVWEGYLLAVRYRRFFLPFFLVQVDKGLSWWREVWPFQWRMAVPGLVQYVAYFLFTPVMFHYHGAAVAGQMGMTWTILTALQAAAFSWVQTRVPLFGVLIARHDFRELDRVFRRVATIAFVILAISGLGFWTVIVVLNVFEFPLSEKLAARLLSPLPTALFTLAIILFAVPQYLSAYLLAHKRNPFLVLGTLGNGLIGLGVWLLGARFGPVGAGGALFVVTAVLIAPCSLYIWDRCRKQWHAGSVST